MPIVRLAVFATVFAVLAMPAMAEGDAAKGERVFRKCKACHAVGENAKNKVGPQLNGIVGAEIASVEGFRYSKAFVERKSEGLVWTVQELDAYLAKPRDHTPGTKMSFAGLRKEQERADVIAYLRGYE